MRDLPSFVQKLPPDIMSGVRTYTGAHMVLFKPNVYVAVPMYTQDDYHFFIPAASAPPAVLGGKEITIDGNRFAAINPHSCTVLKIDRHIPAREYIALSVKREFIQQIAGEMGYHGEVRFAHTNNPCTYRINQLVRIYEEEMSDNPLALVDDSISTLLVSTILRSVRSNIPQREEAVHKGSFVDQAIDYMRAYYDADISVGDICDAVNVSQYHFIRTFKRDTGMTPYEYLLDIRMEQAKELMRRQYPVAETARQCGFVNAAHFTTSFRRRFGMSPSQYKKLS